MFCKKDVFKNFRKFTGKHLCQRLFCFPVNFVKFLRTPFLQNTSWWLFLDLLYFHYHGYVICLIIPVISEKIIPIMSKVIRFFLIFIQSFSSYGKSYHIGIFCYCFCSILDLPSVQRLVYILNFKLVKSLSQVLLLWNNIGFD